MTSFIAAVLLLDLVTSTVAQPQNETDLQRERHIAIHFDLANGWKRDRNVMDSVWKPLGLRGINDYAFGAPLPPDKFASRSDPSSPLYQAWFGVYTVGGGKTKFANGNPRANLNSAIALTELDQRSWLDSMGDPKPLATSHPNATESALTIDGSSRTIYHFDMDSHSDLTASKTELARYMGMPPKARWQKTLSAFHNLVLHIDYTFWYDAVSDATFVVYGASAALRDKSGALHDNATIEPVLKRMMASVKDQPEVNLRAQIMLGLAMPNCRVTWA